jgi:hypothetical protein
MVGKWSRTLGKSIFFCQIVFCRDSKSAVIGVRYDLFDL